MIIFLFMIFLICSVVAAVYLSILLEKKNSFLLALFAGLCWIILVCLLIFTPIQIFELKAASEKAKIINQEYGTNYTREDVFYAEDVINVILETKGKARK